MPTESPLNLGDEPMGMTFQKALGLTVWGVSALLIGLTSWAVQVGYRLNLTASMPVGIYQTRPLNQTPLHRGMIVILCPNSIPNFQLAKARGYLPPGHCPGQTQSLLKPIAALPGDQVQVTPEGLRVNGRLLANSKTLTQDSAHRLMTGIPLGTYPVPSGKLWLISSHSARSFDSRYFGPVSISTIQAIARPVFTGESPSP